MATVAQRLSDFGQRALEAPWTWLDMSRGITEGGSRAFVLVSKIKKCESVGWIAAVATAAKCAQEGNSSHTPSCVGGISILSSRCLCGKNLLIDCQ